MAKFLRGKLGSRGLILGCLVLGLMGIVVCGYGYAATSSTLIIQGEATMKPDEDVEITKLWVNWTNAGANEGYNSKHTTKTVSLYPQVPNATGEIVYWITTCNRSTTQTYELTGMKEQIKNMYGIQLIYADFKVGDLARIGTLLAPGECKNGRVDAYRDANNAGSQSIASLQIDFDWTPYDPTPFSIDYMQDMTPTECAKVGVKQKKQLIDRRDGKKYWVEKTADGQCWMTQNLALDLSTSKTLTPNDTDVRANWTPRTNTNYFKYNQSNTLNVHNDQNYLLDYSWNLGDGMMMATPRARVKCSTYGNNWSAVFTDNVSSVCGYAGVIDVSGAGWQPTYEMQQGTAVTLPDPSWLGANFAGWTAANPQTKQYDAHYMLGNYYQFAAATAGSGLGITGVNDAPDSICPKGWQLPKAGLGRMNTPKSFTYLYKTYGLVTAEADMNDENGLTPPTPGAYGVFWPPFYAALAGYISPNIGILTELAVWGGSWSSTVDTLNYYARNLAIREDGILRTYGGINDFLYGMNVRCVAR